MIIDDRQKDAITEVINIAFGRAADSLSQITGQRVLLEVPKISILPISQLVEALSEYVKGELVTIHQIFTGTVSGDAMLLLDYQSALELNNLLSEETLKIERITGSARDILTEVGNIILNACLGTFSNLLHFKILFSVPRLQLSELDTMMNSIVIGQEEIRYAMVVTAKFRVKDNEVGGYMIIVLGVASLDVLINAIDKLG